MSFPVVFHIGPIHLSGHLLFELLAFALGFRYFLYLRKPEADPISSVNRLWILIGATMGALLGSRLLGALESPDLFFSGRAGWLYYYQSKTIVGGLLGGLIGVESIKKVIGENRSSGDLFTFPIMLGMIVGRIGCFSAGVSEPTFGLPSDLPWAMDLGDGIPRHPTALYEIVYLISLWLALLLLERKYQFTPGSRFKIFMSGYLYYRLGVEFIRPGQPILFGLNAIQLASLAGLIYYWRVWLRPTDLIVQPASEI